MSQIALRSSWDLLDVGAIPQNPAPGGYAGRTARPRRDPMRSGWVGHTRAETSGRRGGRRASGTMSKPGTSKLRSWRHDVALYLRSDYSHPSKRPRASSMAGTHRRKATRVLCRNELGDRGARSYHARSALDFLRLANARQPLPWPSLDTRAGCLVVTVLTIGEILVATVVTSRRRGAVLPLLRLIKRAALRYGSSHATSVGVGDRAGGLRCSGGEVERGTEALALRVLRFGRDSQLAADSQAAAPLDVLPKRSGM